VVKAASAASEGTTFRKILKGEFRHAYFQRARPCRRVRLGLGTTATAESIREKTDRKAADIPTCGRNLGSIAIREPDHNGGPTCTSPRPKSC